MLSNFQHALAHVLAYEGGYVNDPVDLGGETYKGISRRHNPDWPGWKLVDHGKALDDFPDNLGNYHDLRRATEDLYRERYWAPIRGDEIRDREICVELMDTAVNMGVHHAAKFLQEALNLMNRDQHSWPDLFIDGRIGPKTLDCLDLCLAERDGRQTLLKLLNTLQAERYLNIMRGNPSQEKYARGWLKRA